MAPKRKERIRARDFKNLKKGREVSLARQFSLRFSKDSSVKVSVVVSGSVARGARRNLLRRRVYEAFGRARERKSVVPGSFVFFARAGSPALSYREIERQIIELAESIKKY